MSKKLSPTQQKVLELASRPQGLNPREPAYVIGRSNGKTQAAQALVRKGLVIWDKDRYRAVQAAPVETKQEQKVTPEEVKSEPFIIAEFLLILQWWASEYPDMPLTSTQVWEMYRQGVRVGKVWDEVLEDLKLPEMLNW